MQVEITRKSAKAMARRLRTALQARGVSTAESYEALARALGYQNWDHLSGVLKNAEAAQALPTLATPVTLYTLAHCTNSWSGGPSWARIAVDDAFVKRLAQTRQQVRQQDLSDVSVNDFPTWQNNDDWRMECDELRISKDCFWFAAMPRHADDEVRTSMVNIDVLLALLGLPTEGNDTKLLQDNAAWYVRRGDVILHANDGDFRSLVEMLLEDGEPVEALAREFTPDSVA